MQVKLNKFQLEFNKGDISIKSVLIFIYRYYLIFFINAWATANLAIGTLNGEHDT